MKRILLLLVSMSAIVSSLCGQSAEGGTIALQRAEQKLIMLYAKEDYEYIEAYSDSLSQLFLNHPETMDYPFTLLRDETFLGIRTSADGKVRIYSWDDRLGGTMRFYNNIVQLRTDTGVQTVYYKDGYDHDERDFVNGYYTHLLTLPGKTATYYLLVYNNICSTMPECKTRNIYAFTLTGSGLVLQKNFFESENEETGSIEILDALREYGFPDTEMVYKNNTLYFPRCRYNTDDFEKYVRYHFDGTMFRVVKG